AEEDNVHLRLTGQVRAGERDLAKTAQREVGEEQPEEPENCEVSGGLPPWPEAEAQQRGTKPDGGDGEQQERAARSGESLWTSANSDDTEDPVGAQIERQGEDHAGSDDGERHHHDTRGEERRAG